MTSLTEGFNIILLIIGAGCMGYEIVFSELAYLVKRLFCLHQEQPVVQLLGSLKVYRKLLGLPLTLLLFPILFAVIFTAQLHRYIFKLLQCPFCTTFWIATGAAHLVLDVPIVMAIIIGCCSLMSTALYNLIRMKSV